MKKKKLYVKTSSKCAADSGVKLQIFFENFQINKIWGHLKSLYLICVVLHKL